MGLAHTNQRKITKDGENTVGKAKLNSTREELLAELNKTRNRFDLEQDILQCWSICDSLDLFIKEYCDGETRLTDDEVFNKIFGIRTVYDSKFAQLWKSFEDSF